MSAFVAKGVVELVPMREQRPEVSFDCVLTDNRSKLDPTFQNENVYYVLRFLVAAIIGENPAAFGLESQPLSSH